MNTDIEKQIEAVIDQKIQNKEMFTAYDISYDLQRNHGVKERHNNMKMYIHDTMAEHISNYYPYKKSLVDVGKGQAFLYHENHSDISGYKPITSCPVISNNHLGTTAVAKDGSTLTSPNGTVFGRPTKIVSNPTSSVLSPNSRDRIIIPAKMLRGASLNPKDVAVVYANNIDSALLICSKSVVKDPDWKAVDKYIVDKSGNIMISERVIFNNGVCSDDSLYRVDLVGDIISLMVED
jgi:hypothetical protein